MSKKLTKKEKRFLKQEWRDINQMTPGKKKGGARERNREKAERHKSTSVVPVQSTQVLVRSTTVSFKVSVEPDHSIPTPREYPSDLTRKERNEKKELSKQFNELITIKQKGGFLMNLISKKEKNVSDEEQTQEKVTNLIPKARKYFKEIFFCNFFSPPAFRKADVEVSKPPKIFFTREAYDDIRGIVGLADGEVGWLGTVRRSEQIPEHFIIEKIKLLKQEVSSVTCKLDAVAIGKHFTELMQTDEGMDEANLLLSWHHSHVNMSVSPSSTDVNTFDALSENQEYYIRGIYNKKGDVNLTLRINLFGITFTNVSWDIIDPRFEERLEQFAEEMNDKLDPESTYAAPV